MFERSRKRGGRFRGTNGRKWTSVDFAITIRRQCERTGERERERARSSAPPSRRKLFFRAGTYPGRREAFFVLTARRSARSPPIFLGDFPPPSLRVKRGRSCNVRCDAIAGVHHRWKLEIVAGA